MAGQCKQTPSGIWYRFIPPRPLLRPSTATTVTIVYLPGKIPNVPFSFSHTFTAQHLLDLYFFSLKKIIYNIQCAISQQVCTAIGMDEREPCSRRWRAPARALGTSPSTTPGMVMVRPTHPVLTLEFKT